MHRSQDVLSRSVGWLRFAIVAILIASLQLALGSPNGGREDHHTIHMKRRASGARESPQCGNNWQAQYARLHAGILKSEPSKQRFAVYKARVNGLGDRLTSAVTIFYYAMLSERAFRIAWRGTIPEATLAAVMEKPNVDWEASPSDSADDSGVTHATVIRVLWDRPGGRHPPDAIDFRVFGGEDLGKFSNARTVEFEMNTGSVDKLFYNPYHRQQLFAWGLRPETAVGCALDYLFRPRPEVLDLVADSYRALQNPDALKIGIQVRMGDAWLGNKPHGVCKGEIDYDNWGRWFRCASKVEDEYRVEGMPVRWYVVSDCPSLRYKAAEKYGPKVLLPTRELVTDHIFYKSGNRTRDMLAFRTAFAEQWLLGMTDFQVITEESSFGRLAALRSLRFRSVYTIRGAEAMAARGRNASWECVQSEFDSFEEVAVNHTWVKVL